MYRTIFTLWHWHLPSSPWLSKYLKHTVAFSDDLRSLPDLPVCSMTNDRFPFPPPTPPTQENFSPHPLLLKSEHCDVLWCCMGPSAKLPPSQQCLSSSLLTAVYFSTPASGGRGNVFALPAIQNLSLGCLSTPGRVESLYVFNSSRVERSVLSNKHSLCNEGFPQLGKAADKTIF